LLELTEEALDDVALLIEVDVVGALDLAVPLGRDDDLGSGFGDLVAQMIGIVALIADRGARLEAIDKLMCEGDVVALSRRTDQAERIAERVTGGMDLRAKPASRPAQALGIRPPFSLRAPAAC
jgi:hypothetical protein